MLSAVNGSMMVFMNMVKVLLAVESMMVFFVVVPVMNHHHALSCHSGGSIPVVVLNLLVVGFRNV
jgi:hypothetical protein